MDKIPVIAIFDVGKTNKKLLFFDENYHVVHEESRQLAELRDEDGFPCEDVYALNRWVNEAFHQSVNSGKFHISAVNFSAYGASFVYIDDGLNVMPPMYNYLKPYPPYLQKKFYEENGTECILSRQTASPVLGSLNSGLQIYLMKYERPEYYSRIKWALHLPQYLSFLLSEAIYSDITSIGCHTSLWDFQHSRYHPWVIKEEIDKKLAPVFPCTEIAGHFAGHIPVGVGLHDSSAALIPYLASFQEPFLLLSTGTWCISLNPFNGTGLTNNELNQDCLCYLTYEGKPVKASRLFAGYEHEQQIKKLSVYFDKPLDYFTTVKCEPWLLEKLRLGEKNAMRLQKSAMISESVFSTRNLADYLSYEEAYHRLILDIVNQQVSSTRLVLAGAPVSRLFVDGGFSKNPIYMHLLAEAFPDMEVYAASVAQASSMGAALAIHRHWNSKPIPSSLVELKKYSVSRAAAL